MCVCYAALMYPYSRLFERMPTFSFQLLCAACTLSCPLPHRVGVLHTRADRRQLLECIYDSSAYAEVCDAFKDYLRFPKLFFTPHG